MPTPIALPLTITLPNMALTFVADATVGVKLTTLDHTEGGSFVWDLDALLGTTVSPTGDGSLWHAEARRWDQESNALPSSARIVPPTIVGPRHSKQFIAYDYTSDIGYEEAYCFQWTGVVIPGAEDSDSMWVQLFVEWRDALDTKVYFRLNYGRERGGIMTIDAISCPALHVVKPTVDERRVRVLSHNALNVASPGFAGHNVPFGVFASGAKYEMDYPSPYSSLPFMTIAAMDSTDVASFRRCLHVQVEDVAGYHHRWMRVGGSVGGSECLDLHHEYLPSYTRCYTGTEDTDGLAWESYGRNECAGSYSVALTAFTAATDAFWFDACRIYRAWAQAEKGKSLRLANARLGDLGKESTVFIATQIDDGDYILNNQGAADLLVSYIETVVRSLAGSPVAVRLAVELQAPLKYGTRARIPTVGDIDGPGWGSEIWGKGTLTIARAMDLMLARLHDENPTYEVVTGIDVGIYTRPGDLPAYVPRNDQGFSQLRATRGRKTPFSGAERTVAPGGTVEISDTERLDLAHPGTQEYTVKEYLQTATSNGMRGVYMDTFGGIYPSYPRRREAVNGRHHPAHGGTYSTDACEVIGQRVRDELAPRWVVNELFSESVIGLVDSCQPDYNYAEGMMVTGEASFLGALVDVMPSASHPTQARDLTPPLVQACWNPYHSSLRLGFAPIDLSLSTSLVHPGPLGEPGMSVAQWLDVFCYTHGCSFLAGQSCVTLEFFMNRLTRILDADDGGVGTQAWDFIKRRIEWVNTLKRFLIHGQLERPLIHDPMVDTVLKQNPVFTSRTVVNQSVSIPDVPPNPDFQKYIGTPFFVGPADPRILPYNCPQVMHSVWSDPATGDILILMVNWSTGTPVFNATYDEAIWGMAGASASRISRDGTLTPLGTTTPTTTVSANGLGALNVALQARSVAAILLEP